MGMFSINLFISSLLLGIVTIVGDTECVNILTYEDRRTNKSSLRIVQYNAEWLYIDHDTSFDCPGSQCTWANISEAETHLSFVAKVINELNPDIINLCEVEGCDELNMLIDVMDDSYVGYLKKGTDSSTGQNVGMLTRIDPNIDLYRTETRVAYPIYGSNCGYTGEPGTSGVSKHFITEFTIQNMNVAFISAHLIAIPTDPVRCAQREAQAQVLQYVINDYIQKDFEIIMLGDFNDYDNEVLDVNSNIPISHTLDILKGQYGEKKDMYELITITSQLEQKERYSDWWDSDNNCNTSSTKDYSMIDHILVTQKISNIVENVFVYHGYDEYCGKYNSDHYPLVIDITI